MCKLWPLVRWLFQKQSGWQSPANKQKPSTLIPTRSSAPSESMAGVQCRASLRLFVIHQPNTPVMSYRLNLRPTFPRNKWLPTAYGCLSRVHVEGWKTQPMKWREKKHLKTQQNWVGCRQKMSIITVSLYDWLDTQDEYSFLIYVKYSSPHSCLMKLPLPIANCQTCVWATITIWKWMILELYVLTFFFSNEKKNPLNEKCQITPNKRVATSFDILSLNASY